MKNQYKTSTIKHKSSLDKNEFEYRKHILASAVVLCLSIYAFTIADNKLITLWVNGQHQDTLNFIITAITHMADGIVLICFTILLYFFRPFHVFLIGFIAIVVHGAIIYISKEYIFVGDDWSRPYGVLGEKLSLTPYIITHTCCTFPSGHTASGFVASGLFCHAFGSKYRQRWWILGYVFGFLVAFSRLYLLQHWFRDVCVGAFVGIYSFLFAQWVVEKYWNALSQLDFIRFFKQK